MYTAKRLLVLAGVLASMAAFSESRGAGNNQRKNLETNYYYFDRSGGYSNRAVHKHVHVNKTKAARQCSCPCKQ